MEHASIVLGRLNRVFGTHFDDRPVDPVKRDRVFAELKEYRRRLPGYDAEAGGGRLRRSTPIAPPASASVASTTMSHKNSGAALTLGVCAAVRRIGTRALAPGSCNRLRQAAGAPEREPEPAGVLCPPRTDPGVLEAWFNRVTTLPGSEVARDGVPGPGAYGPLADGTSAQYWLAALAVELLHGAPGARPEGERASPEAGRAKPVTQTNEQTRRCVFHTAKVRRES